MSAEVIVPATLDQVGASSNTHAAEKMPVILPSTTRAASIKSSNDISDPEHYQPRNEIATLSPPVGQFVISTLLNVAGFAAAIAFGVFAVRSVSLAIASNDAAHQGNTYASKANDLASSANVIASTANDQSVIANQVALIGLCLSNQNNSYTSPCAQILQRAADILPSAASKLSLTITTAAPSTSGAASSTVPILPSTPGAASSTAPTLPTSTSGGSGGPTQAPNRKTLVGAIVGSILGFIAIVLLSIALIIRMRRRSRRSRRGIQAASGAGFSSRISPGLPLHTENPISTSAGEDGMRKKVSNKHLGLRFRKYFIDSTVISTAKD